MFAFLKKLFGKKEAAPVVSPTVLSFNVDLLKDDKGDDANFVGIHLKDAAGFLNFLRNSDFQLDPRLYSDKELAHMFIYQYCQNWLAENLKQPMFTETHTFQAHGEIKYERVWNTAFAESVAKIGFDTLPPSEDEMMEMYMNYIYGTRLMEEMEMAEAAAPQSVAHPQLTSPDNQFKG